MEGKEKICRNCSIWYGDETDDTAFCDEKDTETSAASFCTSWHGRREFSDHMTEAQKLELLEMEKKGCTDSSVEDFCERNGISPRAAFHQLAIWNAPKQCKGCGHIDMFASIPPCSSCARAHTKDYYSPESPETEDPLRAEKNENIPADWVREKIGSYPGMESAMWTKLLHLWESEPKNIK